MENQVLARKWRPKTFHEVVGQPYAVKALINGLDNQRLHHAFLFTGTRGVGKTTIARILAKSLNCEKGISSTPCGTCSVCQSVDLGNFVDLIEIDAASRTKVEDTREILDNVQYAPTKGRFKVYLIDEVHMLSNSSFNALLKTLEEPPSHVKFLLATTDPQKLPVTILSRCLRFHLKKISIDDIAQQIEKILTFENIPFESKAILLLAKAGQGSMRDALSLTDQAIAYSNQNITLSVVSDMLGTIDHRYILKLMNVLASFSPNEVIECSKEIRSLGLSPENLLEDLITQLHQLSLLKINPEFVSFDNQQEQQEWLSVVDKISQQDIQLFYQIALHGRKDLPLNPDPELGLEMTLLRMILMRPITTSTKNSQKPNGSQPKEDERKITAINNHQPEQLVKKQNNETNQIETIFDQKYWLTLVKELEDILSPIEGKMVKHLIFKSLTDDSLNLVIDSKFYSLIVSNQLNLLKSLKKLTNRPKLTLNISPIKENEIDNLQNNESLASHEQSLKEQKSITTLNILENSPILSLLSTELNGVIQTNTLKFQTN